MKKKVIAFAAIAIVALVGLSTFGIYSYDKWSNGYIMTFDGKKISAEEFKLFLDFEQSETDVKENALETLTKQLVVEKALSINGITASESEAEEIKNNVETMKDNYKTYEIPMPKISDDRLGEIFSVNILYSKLYDIYATDYVLDNEDFTNVFEDYKENGRRYYIDTQMKYIITATKEEAETAKERVLAGEEIDDIIIECSSAYSDDYGIEKISLGQIQLTDEQVEGIMALEVGELSDVIEMSSSFVVFYIDEIIIPTDEELYNEVKTAYETGKKDELTNVELQKIRDESNVKVNNKAFNSIA